MESGERSRGSRGVGSAFWLGAAGTSLVFAAFYLRNPRPVHEHAREFGALGVAIAAACLAAVAAGGGLWARINDPRTRLKAFSLGLALPSVVFALGATPGSGGETAAALLSAARGSALGNALRLVLAPVQAKAEADNTALVTLLGEERLRLTHAREELASAAAETAALSEAVASLRRDAESVDSALARAAAVEDAARAEIAQLRSRLDEARAEVSPDDVARVVRLVRDLDAEKKQEIVGRVREGDLAGAAEDLLHPFRGRREESLLISAYLPFAYEALGAARVQKPQLRVVVQ